MRGPSLKMLPLLASFFALVSCSGFLKMRLKSEYALDATIIMSQELNPAMIALPMRLPEKKVISLGPFPIDFHRNCSLTIMGSRTEELGINGSSYRAQFEPLEGLHFPNQLNLPLSGLELSFECENNFSGPKCDSEGRRSESSAAPSRLLEITSDYEIDMEKLPTIIGRFKETTKVENALREEERLKEKKKEEEKLKKRKEEEEESNEEQLLMEEEDVKDNENPMKDIMKSLMSSLMAMPLVARKEQRAPFTMLTSIERSLPKQRSYGSGDKEYLSAFSRDTSHSSPKTWHGVRSLSAIRPSSLFLDFLPRFQRHTLEGSGEVPEGSGFVSSKLVKN